MSKIDELIEKICPNGVRYEELRNKKLFKFYYGKGNKIPEDNGGIYNVYGANGVVSHIDEYNCEDISIIGHIGAVGMVNRCKEKCFVTYNGTIAEVVDKSKVNSQYLYYVLTTLDLPSYKKGSQPFLSVSDFDKISIPVPPLEVQCEIVHILDDFTLLSAELSAELEARKRQYCYYREKLFEFNNDGELKTMGELFPFIRNGFVGTIRPFFTDEKNGIRYLEGTNIHNGIISDNEMIYVTKEFHQRHKKNELKEDDILMVQSGHIGECAVVGKKYKGANCHALIIMSNGGKCLSKYIVHYFHTLKGFKALNPAITGGTIKHVLAGKIGKIKVPCPPIEEQTKIVNILDKLEKLCNDISEGLPAEIEARQKQYEYYRDKLLTFKELKVNE